MNCLSALRGVCAPLSVGKVCHCAPPIAQQLRCAELSQGHCADPQQQACMALNYRYQHCAGLPAVPHLLFPCCCAAVMLLWLYGRCCVLLHRASDSWRLPGSLSLQLALLLGLLILLLTLVLQPSSCLTACIPDGMLGTLLLARNIVLPLLPRDGTHIPIHYPEFITLINFAIAHNCAPALTGIISRLRTRLRTPISSVVKYSLRSPLLQKR